MDLRAVIKALRQELAQTDQAIAMLQRLQDEPGSTQSRPSRKFMSPEERKIVAERMTRYWASRRKNQV